MPHVIKFVLHDKARRDTLNILRFKFEKTLEKKPGLRIIQDRIDHIKLCDNNNILLEYTLVVMPVVVNWERIRAYCFNVASNPEKRPTRNVSKFECMDWETTT
jgi:hypothetical protein